MQNATQDKLLTNQLKDIVGKDTFDEFEVAELIDSLITLRRADCPACAAMTRRKGNSAPKGMSKRGGKGFCPDCAKVPEVLAEQLNITKKQLYTLRKMVEAEPETKQAVKEHKISATKARTIVYGLKDSKKKEELAIVERVIKEDLDTKETEMLVAEVNTPSLIKNHCKSHLWRAINELKKAQLKVQKGMDKDVEFRDLIDQAREYLSRIESKGKT